MRPHLSPTMRVLCGVSWGCAAAMTSAVTRDGFPIRSGSRPAPTDTAAIMAPVAKEEGRIMNRYCSHFYDHYTNLNTTQWFIAYGK